MLPLIGQSPDLEGQDWLGLCHIAHSCPGLGIIHLNSPWPGEITRMRSRTADGLIDCRVNLWILLICNVSVFGMYSCMLSGLMRGDVKH